MRRYSIIKQSGGRFLLYPLMAIFFTMAFLANTISEAKDPAYPIKPITLIVPWAPGSAVDLVPRIMTPYLSKKLSVPVNIINKPGGSGIVGTL